MPSTGSDRGFSRSTVERALAEVEDRIAGVETSIAMVRSAGEHRKTCGLDPEEQALIDAAEDLLGTLRQHRERLLAAL